MKLSTWIGILFFILQCCTGVIALAQPAPQPTPTAQQWQQLTADKAFGYKTEKEGQQVKKQEDNTALLQAIAVVLTFFSSGIGKALIWTLLFLFAGWALYKIFFSDKTFIWARREKKQETYEDEMEDLVTTDWNAQLQKAMQAGEARLAIRYSYMLLLQLLQQKGQIQYRPDKTNYEYYRELNETYKKDFRTLTRQYEYVWYGNFDVAEDSYRRYMDTFNQLKKTL